MKNITPAIDTVINAALVNRIVGCVVLVRREGQEIYARAAGFADREENRAMQRDAIFRLASVTKPIVATAVLRLMEDGVVSLNDHVTKYLPWFTPPSPDGTVSPITIQQLLTHTSGVHYTMPNSISTGLAGPVITLEENLRRLAKTPLAFAPGTGWTYGKSIDVLGGVLAVINNSSLDDALVKYVTGPLAMTDTHFYVTDQNRLAIPYADGSPPRRMGEPETVIDDHGNPVVFSPERIFQTEAPQSGGAGLAGTADDVMAMLECYHHNSFLKPATTKLAMSNQIGKLHRDDAGRRFSFIGAYVEDAKLAKTPYAAGAIEWGGAWGHNWMLDPATCTSVLICTNTAFEGCSGKFPGEIHRALYGVV